MPWPPTLTRHKQFGKRIQELLARHESRRGLLVAFEGPDGSGKTTQRRLFADWLKSDGHQVVTTKWNSSPLIKPLTGVRKKAQALNPEEFSLLHAADFRWRLENQVMPALWQGRMVIADRYLFTGLARDAARGLDLDWLLTIYSPILWPDLVLYFSVSPETSSRRITAERSPSFYEAGQDITDLRDPVESYRHFTTRVIQEYEALAKIFQFVTVDAERSIYDQHMEIRRRFERTTRRSWAEWNTEAMADWLDRAPALEVRHAG